MRIGYECRGCGSFVERTPDLDEDWADWLTVAMCKPCVLAQPTKETAAAARSEGMARVEANADPDWKAQAWDVFVEYLQEHQEYFGDDFWERSAVRLPHELRAIGPMVQRAKRAGYLVEVGARSSVRSHGSPRPVYRSLIFKGRGL